MARVGRATGNVAFGFIGGRLDTEIAYAYYNLGLVHRDGDEVPRNLRTAREYLERAAGCGHPSARRVANALREHDA